MSDEKSNTLAEIAADQDKTDARNARTDADYDAMLATPDPTDKTALPLVDDLVALRHDIVSGNLRDSRSDSIRQRLDGIIGKLKPPPAATAPPAVAATEEAYLRSLLPESLQSLSQPLPVLITIMTTAWNRDVEQKLLKQLPSPSPPAPVPVGMRDLPDKPGAWGRGKTEWLVWKYWSREQNRETFKADEVQEGRLRFKSKLVEMLPRGNWHPLTAPADVAELRQQLAVLEERDAKWAGKTDKLIRAAVAGANERATAATQRAEGLQAEVERQIADGAKRYNDFATFWQNRSKHVREVFERRYSEMEQQLTTLRDERDRLAGRVIVGDGKPLPEGAWVIKHPDGSIGRFTAIEGRVTEPGLRYLRVDTAFACQRRGRRGRVIDMQTIRIGVAKAILLSRMKHLQLSGPDPMSAIVAAAPLADQIRAVDAIWDRDTPFDESQRQKYLAEADAAIAAYRNRVDTAFASGEGGVG